MLARRGQGAEDRSTTFGSSRWARWNDIEALKLINDHGFWLGRYTSTPAPRNWLESLLRRQKKEELRSEIIRYQGDRHLLTCAPTRSGKGVSSIIPTLLTYEGSALVIDPKAENAIRTAEARRAMGQKVHLIDPWGLTRDFLPDIPVAHFNPLDWIRDGHPDALDNAMLLADALVMTRAEAKEPFWDDEAKALIAGIILHVATSESEEGNRNLRRVRDILSSDTDTFEDTLIDMSQSHYPMVSGTAARTASKEERVRSNVMTTAQSHTHWLENEAICASLESSDLDFADLKTGHETVYLILPADRLETYNRWLRALVQQAITVNARNIAQKPKRPVLFLLDEMASLGPLASVRNAYSLMAGYGMQLWGIVQDFGQLERLYGSGWETFIGNSGVIQYFGSRDLMTTEYIAKLCGKTTVKSFSISRALGKDGSSSSESVNETQRDLAFPDELMTLRNGAQLVFVENGYPIRAERTPWYETAPLNERGRHLPGEISYQEAKPIDPPSPVEPEPESLPEAEKPQS